MGLLYDIKEDFAEIRKDSRRSGAKIKPECKVRLMSDRGLETEYDGVLWKGEQFVFIEKLNRVHFVSKKYDNGKHRIVYVPEGTHSGDNEDFAIKLANAMSVSGKLKWKYQSVWRSIKFENIKGSIDWNLLDNDISPNFAVNAFDVFKAKVLEFLASSGDKETNMAMVMGACVGAVGIKILEWVGNALLLVLAGSV